MAQQLARGGPQDLQNWIGRLVDLGVFQKSGRTRGLRYFVHPELLKSTGLDLHTTLSRIEPHRLAALLIEDVVRYPGGSLSEIPDSRASSDTGFAFGASIFSTILARMLLL